MSQPRKPGFVEPENVDAYLAKVGPAINAAAAAIELLGDDWLECLCSTEQQGDDHG